MENLKIIENKLVPVYETSTGEKVVYGTELHVVLEVKSNYREWINRRFSDIDAISNEDFEAVEISTPSGQRKKTTSSNWTLPRKWRCWSATRKASRCAGISLR